MTKRCSKCGEVKDVGEFGKRKDSLDGYRNQCKICQRELKKKYRKKNIEKITLHKKEYYQANKDKINLYMKEYQKANKEKLALQKKEYNKKNKDKIALYMKEYCKDYYQENKDKHALYYRVWNKKNKEKVALQKKEYRKANKDKIYLQNKEYREVNKDKITLYQIEYCKKNKEKIALYYQANKDKINLQKKEWEKRNKEKLALQRKEYRKTNKDKIALYLKNKYKTNVRFRIEQNIRGRIYNAIISQNTKKAYKTIELLGCTIEEARQHLEKQFTDGMSWNNHSFYGWHIDHIIPCASFDLTDPEQQKQCFHYTNLQPLWAEDNLSKGAKYNKKGFTNGIQCSNMYITGRRLPGCPLELPNLENLE